MAKTENIPGIAPRSGAAKCALGDHCINVERVVQQATSVVAKLEDIRLVVVDAQHSMRDWCAMESAHTAERLSRGSTYFDKIFERQERSGKQVLAMWFLVGGVCLGELGKFLSWLYPAISGWF